MCRILSTILADAAAALRAAAQLRRKARNRRLEGNPDKALEILKLTQEPDDNFPDPQRSLPTQPQPLNSDNMTRTFPNKFAAILAGALGAGGLEARAALLATQAQTTQQVLINTLNSKVLEKEFALAALTDFGPESTFSLKPGGNFDPATWANAYHKAAMELKDLKEELEVAKATYEQFFGVAYVEELPTPATPPA